MTLYLFLLSIVFVLGFVGVTSKPSPIYGGVGLIVSGAIGCGMVLLYGGSYLGLMVFLIYLGGMLVVFGYTTAMATEEYPDTWGSNKFVSGLMLVGLFMELAYMMWLLYMEGVDMVVGFDDMGEWVVYEGEEVGVLVEDSVGVAALYSYGTWMMLVAGWSLLVTVFIVIEITRGN
uniref:NADH-ubiquinone oxidoreductase chain 6 n=1 Tax=Typhlomys cinereus TaxID=687455 RepID=A0A343AUA0_9RODE|nr:NADH dehydrogenase subunit 6 [Typhlomys cinereus]APQ47846.1 NADH dehydrogenase subunit 6 [Typhlomys cinereus]